MSLPLGTTMNVFLQTSERAASPSLCNTTRENTAGPPPVDQGVTGMERGPATDDTFDLFSKRCVPHNLPFIFKTKAFFF